MALFASILPVPLASPELMLFVLLALGVTAMSAVAFILWLAFHAVRFVAMLLFGWRWGGEEGATPAPRRLRACPDPVCRSVNPIHANYCRQCGRVLRSAVEYREESAGESRSVVEHREVTIICDRA